MLKKKIEYKDFLGNDRSRTLYFHISMADAQRMIMRESTIDSSADPEDSSAVKEMLSARIKGVMDRGKGGEILELFDWLVENAYGIIDDDGESFIKSPEVYKEWTNTASYNAFFESLLLSTKAMSEFVNGVFPEDLMDRADEQDPEFKRHREMLEKHKKSQ